MADILIRGMEMPKTCGVCPLFSDDFNDYCMAARSIFLSSSIKPDWCPLVPLPEGHGRLIDETELIAKLVCHCKDLRKLSTKTIGETIGLCATIVPAEGGTDECSEN